MPPLYELTGQYKVLVDTLDTSEDLNPMDFCAAIEKLKDSIEAKAGNVAKAILSYDAEAKMVKDEIERLYARGLRAERLSLHLREYLKQEMETVDILKIKRPEFTVSIAQNPPRVNVVDEQAIPTPFWRIIPEQKVVDKRLILERAKEGEVVPGVVIVTGTRLSIR